MARSEDVEATRQQYIDKMKRFEDKQDMINKKRKTLKVTTAPAPGPRATASESHILCCNGCGLRTSALPDPPLSPESNLVMLC